MQGDFKHPARNESADFDERQGDDDGDGNLAQPVQRIRRGSRQHRDNGLEPLRPEDVGFFERGVELASGLEPLRGIRIYGSFHDGDE